MRRGDADNREEKDRLLCDAVSYAKVEELISSPISSPTRAGFLACALSPDVGSLLFVTADRNLMFCEKLVFSENASVSELSDELISRMEESGAFAVFAAYRGRINPSMILYFSEIYHRLSEKSFRLFDLFEVTRHSFYSVLSDFEEANYPPTESDAKGKKEPLTKHK